MVWQLPGDFHRPFPSFPQPVPVPGINPENEKLVQVCFNEKWLPYILGALWQLTEYATWNTTDPATMEETLAQANQLIWLFQSAKPCKGTIYGSAGAEGAEDIMIRQNPDNPCLLETSINGTDWCVFADISLCQTSTVPQARNAEQPTPNGGQACYDMYLAASERALLPTNVSAGDVISFEDIQGLGSDGTAFWQCPDGSGFFLNECTGIYSTDGADPKPTASHMTILAHIGSSYYDITQGPITVPGGVSNAPVTFQVNDSTLSDNSGSYTFRVCVTNNQTTTFTHVFDFTTGTQGWSIWGTHSLWTAGTGFEGICFTYDSGNRAALQGSIQTAPLRTFTATSIDVLFDRNYINRGADQGDLIRANTSVDLVSLFPVVGNGNDVHLTWTGSQSVNTAAGALRIIINFSGVHDSPSSCPIVGSSGRIKKITISGAGADPFV